MASGSSPQRAWSGAPAEPNYKTHMDAVLKDNKILKQKLQNAESENKKLKQSIFELSLWYSRFASAALKSQQGQQLRSTNAQSPVPETANEGDNASEKGRKQPSERSKSATVENGAEVDKATEEKATVHSYDTDIGTTLAMSVRRLLRNSDGEGLVLPNFTDLEVPQDTTGADVRPLFYPYMRLEGHDGAVYDVKWSPRGPLLASAGFDKTLRLWHVGERKTAAVLSGHTLNVAEVCWSSDGTKIASASYDRTCRLWNVATGHNIRSWSLDYDAGFALCVDFDRGDSSAIGGSYSGGSGLGVAAQSTSMNLGDSFNSGVASGQEHVINVGTSRKQILTFDQRSDDRGQAQAVLWNDSAVSTLIHHRDGPYLTSGDMNGYVRIWDLRQRSVLHEYCPAGPKSHARACANLSFSNRCVGNGGSGGESLFLAGNFYDNTVRLFERGIEAPHDTLRPLHSAKGHNVRNYPIGCSIFQGRDYIYTNRTTGGGMDDDEDSVPRKLQAQRTNKAEQRQRTGTDASTAGSMSRRIGADATDIGGSYSLGMRANGGMIDHPMNVNSLLLVATGSSDGLIYLYDFGSRTTLGETHIAQTLAGHLDRVYSVDFHPSEPFLASGAGDGTARIWAGRALKPLITVTE
eukprot:Clim_evm12s8 gene=Clim_evmTU12s8